MSSQNNANSSPSPVEASQPGPEVPGTARKNTRIVDVIVTFLDGSKTVYQVSQKALGKTLFYQVCDSLNLVEVDYFGLEYFDENSVQFWLDLEKPISKQLSLQNLCMNFAVKFYPPEPSTLEDELTRYLFTLQIRKDLADGSLLGSDKSTSILISSVITAFEMQSQHGDFHPGQYERFSSPDITDFEVRVIENHRKLAGMSAAEAELQMLEYAKTLDMYGIKLSSVTDHEGIPLNLSCTHNGILVYQIRSKINTFEWIKIRKLSFKRKHFFIKLHKEEVFGNVLEFIFQNRNECKNFWKKCIEQHSFFKCFEIKSKSRQKMRVFSRGSSFRYTGRTQRQISDYVRLNNSFRKKKPFQRSSSMKLCGTLRDEYDDHSGYASDANNDLQMTGSMIAPGDAMASCPPGTNTLPHNRSIFKSVDTIDRQSVSIAPSSYVTHENSLMRSITDDLNSLNISSININATLTSRRFKLPTLMTEEQCVIRYLHSAQRTFLRDLELMQYWFHDEIAKDCAIVPEIKLLDQMYCPLIEAHRRLLTDIEFLLHKCNINESTVDDIDQPMASAVLSTIPKLLNHYEQYLEALPYILDRLHSLFRNNPEFENVCREFEAKRGCYMTYTSFILKPAFHIIFYVDAISNLSECLEPEHCDQTGLARIVEQLANFNTEYAPVLDQLTCLTILIELERDISGFDEIVSNGRRFIREGVLLKLSHKGFKQRLFILFSDILVYASRTCSSSMSQFKIHGYFPVQDIKAQRTDRSHGIANCFSIQCGDKIIVLAALNELDRDNWLRDLERVCANNSCPGSSSQLNLIAQIEQALEQCGTSVKIDQIDPHQERLQSRTSTIQHVCWQRACSISEMEYRFALTISFSGFLLRKFKNSVGWQKLWVELSHFCLFFYKNADDEYPLASLPVIGYTISVPQNDDNVYQSHVFKLHFKTHVYFFRAESDFAYRKWMDVISTIASRKYSHSEAEAFTVERQHEHSIRALNDKHPALNNNNDNYSDNYSTTPAILANNHHQHDTASNLSQHTGTHSQTTQFGDGHSVMAHNVRLIS